MLGEVIEAIEAIEVVIDAIASSRYYYRRTQ